VIVSNVKKKKFQDAIEIQESLIALVNALKEHIIQINNAKTVLLLVLHVQVHNPAHNANHIIT
jgi:hypothetical protein